MPARQVRTCCSVPSWNTKGQVQMLVTMPRVCRFAIPWCYFGESWQKEYMSWTEATEDCRAAVSSERRCLCPGADKCHLNLKWCHLGLPKSSCTIFLVPPNCQCQPLLEMSHYVGPPPPVPCHHSSHLSLNDFPGGLYPLDDPSHAHRQWGLSQFTWPQKSQGAIGRMSSQDKT
jgi:hypothetical protein